MNEIVSKVSKFLDVEKILSSFQSFDFTGKCNQIVSQVLKHTGGYHDYLLAALPTLLLGLFIVGDADLPLFLSRAIPKKAFAGQVVWIVGASSGIGATLAVDFVKAGARVILSARRIQQLNEVASECEKFGEKPMVLALDATDFSQHEPAFQQIIAKYGKIDILVLNSGMSQRNLALETPIEVTESLLRLNLLSYIALNRVVMPSMAERKSGRVVVVSSLSGVIPTPVASSYSTTKFALHGYFDALRSEVALLGLKVSIVCPGPVESEISTKSFRNPNYPVEAKQEKRMETSRFCQLLLKGIYFDFDEMWISYQPFLFFAYLCRYFPYLSRLFLTKIMGPSRVKAIKSGSDVFDLKVAFGINK